MLGAAGALVFAVLCAGSAGAHGEIESTIPKAGSRLRKPPNHLIINFTEPPTKQAVIAVRDGCGRNIVEVVDIQDQVAHIFMAKGEPGKWRVRYDVVSALDGHKTSGGYSLSVTGEKDCSSDRNGGKAGAPPPAPLPGPNGDDEDGSSLPVLPIVLGSAAVIGLAVVARRAAG